MKKKLNVHFSANLIDKNIIKFLEKNFEILLITLNEKELNNPKQEINELIKTIDLIIFTGGEDVNPNYYNEKIGMFTHINIKRDESEFNLLYSKKIPSSIIRNIPKLGICRGAQLLTVYNGGKLIQHVEGHKSNNQIIEVNLTPSGITKTIEIDSDHHQMMFPYDLPEESFEIIGWSKNFQSNTYLNDKNEEIILPENFLESEIIYYKNKNSLCIQSHPEWCIGSEGSDYCLKLINKYLLNNNKQEEKIGYSEYPLPPNMDSYPIGWTVNNPNGELLKFDGNNFVNQYLSFEIKDSGYSPKKIKFNVENSEKIQNTPYSLQYNEPQFTSVSSSYLKTELLKDE